jgi:hypothetical protein
LESKDWNKGVMSMRTLGILGGLLHDMDRRDRDRARPDYTSTQVQKLTTSLPPSVVTVDSTYPVSPLSDPENVSHDGWDQDVLFRGCTSPVSRWDWTVCMPRTNRHLDPRRQTMDKANIQTLPSPSDKRPSTGHTVDLVAHHVLSSGKSRAR